MRKVQGVIAGIVLAAVTVVGAKTAGAASSAQPAAQYQVSAFATGTPGQFDPDDLVQLGSDIFVGWQNGVGSMGEPSSTGNTQSTLVEYRQDGTVVNSWSLTGKIDGMGADQASQQVIATVDEDGNSSLYSVTPSAPPARQVAQFEYAPSGPLPHGGGTDSVTVIGSQIFIAASAPAVANGPALYQATLSKGTATLRPVFFDNSSARVANTNAADFGQKATLALTDPDSTIHVPDASPRFGGDLLVDSQGDQQQVYVSGPGSADPRLSVLNLDQSVDDTVFATDPNGTLYVTDSSSNKVFKVTGDFQPGTAFTSVTPSNANNPVNEPNYLGQLNLNTGQTTPVITTIQAKGLLFVAAGHGGD